MKKIITVLLLAILCSLSQVYAQSRADELMKQAQENLAKKEYIKARYLFLQAYNAFAAQENTARLWSAVLMPAHCITGKIITKRPLNCCAEPSN